MITLPVLGGDMKKYECPCCGEVFCASEGAKYCTNCGACIPTSIGDCE